jgi:hypothetical protein
MRHFSISDSFTRSDRWYLGAPKKENGEEIDPRIFTRGEPVAIRDDLYVPVDQGTRPLDFTLAAFDMPVVKTHVAAIIETCAAENIQRIPVFVGANLKGYEILNVLPKLKALNETHSEISYWRPEDGWPERVGEYSGVAKIVLKKDIVRGVRIFRLNGWEVPIIIDEVLQAALSEARVTGIQFRCVESI